MLMHQSGETTQKTRGLLPNKGGQAQEENDFFGGDSLQEKEHPGGKPVTEFSRQREIDFKEIGISLE